MVEDPLDFGQAVYWKMYWDFELTLIGTPCWQGNITISLPFYLEEIGGSESWIHKLVIPSSYAK